MEHVFGGSEKAAVVIDIGSAYTKCGFAGEAQPRHILPSQFKLLSGKEIPSISILLGSSNYTQEEKKEALEVFLNLIYFHYLQTNPRERRVVLCKNLLAPHTFRAIATEIFIEKLKVPSLAFISTQTLCLVPLSKSIGLIVDCGFRETRVLPIYAGLPLAHAFQCVPLGGESIHKRLGQLLQDWSRVKNPFTNVSEPLFSPPPSKVLEEITASLCFVDPNVIPQEEIHALPWPPNSKVAAKEEIQPQTTESDASQTVTEQVESTKEKPVQQETKKLPQKKSSLQDNRHNQSIVSYALESDKVLQVDLFVRSQSTNILFEGDDEGTSVASLVLDSLIKCAPDIRAELASSILLVGGASMIPGFKKRLINEISHLIQVSPSYEALKGLQQSFRFVESMFGPNYLGWLGGSIIGSLDSGVTSWITKDNNNAKSRRED